MVGNSQWVVLREPNSTSTKHWYVKWYMGVVVVVFSNYIHRNDKIRADHYQILMFYSQDPQKHHLNIQ